MHLYSWNCRGSTGHAQSISDRPFNVSQARRGAVDNKRDTSNQGRGGLGKGGGEGGKKEGVCPRKWQ
ncbi:unnamed protein product [Protopolystoma xenopodis]|uniref:Uncharacterized protein n=1 Tax=Protopolystoma xenopodis TaxID=117903 RepID=A0A448X869_9PLAT|nr:unnamed protein product [Protopolystoma xenopodis]